MTVDTVRALATVDILVAITTKAADGWSNKGSDKTDGDTIF